jgi:hypothetical protein
LNALGYDINYAPFQVSEHIHWSQIWIDAIHLKCQGKGMTPELAKASAYAELAERFSAGLFYQAFEEQVRYNMPALYSSAVNRFLNYEWLDGYRCSHQDDLKAPHLSIETLLCRQHHIVAAHIDKMKNSRMARHWVDGYSLLQDKKVKVPINFVTYINASNGLAAGNTVEEAMLQAACEVFERHTQIQIIKPETTVPSIDPNSLTDSRLKAMIDFYAGENVEVILKDSPWAGCSQASGRSLSITTFGRAAGAQDTGSRGLLQHGRGPQPLPDRTHAGPQHAEDAPPRHGPAGAARFTGRQPLPDVQMLHLPERHLLFWKEATPFAYQERRSTDMMEEIESLKAHLQDTGHRFYPPGPDPSSARLSCGSDHCTRHLRLSALCAQGHSDIGQHQPGCHLAGGSLQAGHGNLF